MARRFDIPPKVLLDLFFFSMSIGYSTLDMRVYRKGPVSLSHTVILVDFVELDMLDFDIILGMDWLHVCYASINFRTCVVKF